MGISDPVLSTMKVSLVLELSSDVIELLTLFKLSYSIWVGLVVAQSIELGSSFLHFNLSSLGHYLSVVIVCAILSFWLCRQLVSFFFDILVNRRFESLKISGVNIDFVYSFKTVSIEHFIFSSFSILLINLLPAFLTSFIFHLTFSLFSLVHGIDHAGPSSHHFSYLLL